MSVLASAAPYYPDVATDVILRHHEDGREGGDGQILEWGVPLGERFRAPQIVLGVLHVQSVDVGAGEVWVDLLSLPLTQRGDEAHVLCRYAVNQIGQRRIGFDSADIPADHTALACRLLMLGGDGSASCCYGVWLTGARP
jgi:hypothetical protein